VSEERDSPRALPEVDVVIVAYNAGALLSAAVGSAAAQAGADHVWVMDAESTDGSVDALATSGLAVHVERVPNAGFSASNNRGIEASGAQPEAAPYVLILNPDAELLTGALDRLVATAEAHPKAGIVGAAILNPDCSPQANAFGRFPTLVNTLTLRVVRLAQVLAGNRSHSPRLPSDATPVDWVTGAALLVRREAIADAGEMDESLFLYYEDVEWCHRMRDGGWDVLLEPAAQVLHHLGQAGAPAGKAAQAYRASFFRYCDIYGLWGLKASVRLGLALRRTFGGRG